MSLVGLSAMLVLAAAVQGASAETLFGSAGRTLEGRRYTTLRALADHLAVTAHGALEAADDETQRGTTSAARLLASVRAFAQNAREFHRALDNYPALPFEVPARVAQLTTTAQQLNDSVRAARGLESSYEDWQAILDVLDRMKMLLSGADVDVPVAHVVAALAGERLSEFQKLAGELATSANRAHETARRDLGEYPDRGQQFLGELFYFATQIRGFNGRADSARIDPQHVGPLVDKLLEDARQADRRMRDAKVFRSVWDDSGRSITILHRMASLVRS